MLADSGPLVGALIWSIHEWSLHVARATLQHCGLKLSNSLLVLQASKGECTEGFTLPVHCIINGYIDCISHHLFSPSFF